jgi:hypothetical protein
MLSSRKQFASSRKLRAAEELTERDELEMLFLCTLSGFMKRKKKKLSRTLNK